MTVTAIALVLVVLFFALFASYEYYERKTGVPTFPSMPAAKRKIVEILQRDIAKRPGEPFVIYDLGSGSGQLARFLACAMPQARVIGVELSYIPWLRSVLRQRLRGPANLEYRRLDFWGASFAEASAIVTYLPGKVMTPLMPKLRAELAEGTPVVVNVFPFPASWVPEEVFEVRVPFRTKVFLYRV